MLPMGMLGLLSEKYRTSQWRHHGMLISSDLCVKLSSLLQQSLLMVTYNC